MTGVMLRSPQAKLKALKVTHGAKSLGEVKVEQACCGPPPRPCQRVPATCGAHRARGGRPPPYCTRAAPSRAAGAAPR